MKIDPARWAEAQHHEADYWGNCLGMRAWGEFVKQEMYGREMGLFDAYGVNGELNVQGKSVMDVGGGPVSMTLRCINADRLIVVDPCEWPASALRRYQAYGIEFIQEAGERLHMQPALGQHDEVWVYNVLQHTQNPKAVLENALARVQRGGVLRIFEWLNIPADECHPHVLTAEWLLNALAGTRVEQIRIRRLKEYWSDADALAGVFSNG